MSDRATTSLTRRSVIASAVGGAAALAASQLVRPAVALATDGDLHLNVGNTSAALTRLTASLSMDTVLDVRNQAAGPSTAFSAATDEGTGVAGYTTIGTGVRGDAMGTGTGVRGLSGSGDGVAGEGGTGVYGTGGYGVMGDVDVGGTAVYGFVGSQAAPVAPASVGVYAAAGASSLTALQVNGKAKFSRSGKLRIAAGRSSIGKTLSGVTTSSLIIATLQTNRSGYYVRAATPASGSFRIYLNKTADVNVYVAFFVIN